MQKREKILAAGLGVVLIAWLGLPMIESALFAPLRDLDSRRIALEDEEQRLTKRQFELARKDGSMKIWRGQSLPKDPLNAQRLYQEWLTNLAQLSGFEISKITLDRRGSEGETYVTIPVTIEARAKLRELAIFLERFESVNLLQRVARCDVGSPANEGDPELAVTLTAEGVAMKSAADRPRLFAQTELFDGVNADIQKLTVASTTGFPVKFPFCVRIGNEFLHVTGADGNTWTVQRGVEKSFSEKHETGSTVEYFPLRANLDLGPVTEQMWSTSLFVKPLPEVEYRPRLASSTPPVAIRGKLWSWKLDVAGWNPAFGSPNYEIVAAPPGIELDKRAGTLKWNVSPQIDVGKQPVQLLVWGTNGRDAGFAATVQVQVRDPNVPPRFTAPESLNFYIGRKSQVRLSAQDPDGDSTKLNYALEKGPEGMAIDSKTGELTWSPAESLPPQKLDIIVKVTDSDDLPESVTATIPVLVAEDSARFTYLTGSVTRSNGVQEAWIYDRATNHNTVVHPGEAVEIAGFRFTVESIQPTSLIVKRDGQLYQWEFEQPLTEMKPVPTASQKS